MDVYQQILLEHYKNPRNTEVLKNPDFSSAGDNPSCGDSVFMQGTIENGKLTDVHFQGKGCVMSQGTASMLTEAVKGKTIDEVLALNKDFIFNLIGTQLGPNRMRCALLPLHALQKGLTEYKEQQKK